MKANVNIGSIDKLPQGDIRLNRLTMQPERYVLYVNVSGQLDVLMHSSPGWRTLDLLNENTRIVSAEMTTAHALDLALSLLGSFDPEDLRRGGLNDQAIDAIINLFANVR